MRPNHNPNVRHEVRRKTHPLLGQVERELGGVVATVEHKQRHGLAGRQPPKQRANLAGGDLVGVVQRMQPGRVDGGGPGVAVEADLGDPLVGPAGDDRLARRMPGRMVVVATLGRALGVTTRPGGHVDREHQRVSGRQATDQQVTQPLGVDPPAGQGGVGAAPAALMDWFQAQVRQRCHGRSAQQRVAQVEQRIGAADEAGVQLGPEGAEPREGEGWRRHGRAA
jgi:hypothetical protein